MTGVQTCALPIYERRVVVISADQDPRLVALMQADVQALTPAHRVLAIRPVMRVMGSAAGEDRLSRVLTAEVILSLGLQAQHAMRVVEDKYYKPYESHEIPEIETHPIELVGRELTRIDLATGTCPFFIDLLGPHAFECIQDGDDTKAVRDVLESLDILQYFFPAPDQLALGIADRYACSPTELAASVSSAESLGHPLSKSEVVSVSELTGMVIALQNCGLVVEGEGKFELTPKGQSIRTTVRFKPRESVVSKILNRVSVNLSLKGDRKSVV